MKIVWLKKQLEEEGETPMPTVVRPAEMLDATRKDLAGEGFMEVGGRWEGDNKIYVYVKLPMADYEVALVNVKGDELEVKYNTFSPEELYDELLRLSATGDLYAKGRALQELLGKFLWLIGRRSK